MTIKIFFFSMVMILFASLNNFAQKMCLTDLVISTRRCDNCYAFVLSRKETWQPGQKIRVRFLNGDSTLLARVIKYAEQWERHANIDFVFDNSANSDITITFTNEGYWSAVGISSRNYNPSMSLTGLDASTPDDEFSRVVLHEFGHALGLMHEHQHARRPFEWNQEAVYKKYSGPPNNWSRQDIYDNLIMKYTDETSYTNFVYDAASIMHYPIDASLTTNGYSVGWNTYLSDNDKTVIRNIYPRSGGANKQLVIDSPTTGTSVGLVTRVRGRTYSPQSNHYILVVSQTAQRYFIQDPVTVANDGTWEGRAAFGTLDYGKGHRWVIWVLTTKAQLQTGEIFQANFPSDATISEPIVVNRTN